MPGKRKANKSILLWSKLVKKFGARPPIKKGTEIYRKIKAEFDKLK